MLTQNLESPWTKKRRRGHPLPTPTSCKRAGHPIPQVATVHLTIHHHAPIPLPPPGLGSFPAPKHGVVARGRCRRLVPRDHHLPAQCVADGPAVPGLAHERVERRDMVPPLLPRDGGQVGRAAGPAGGRVLEIDGQTVRADDPVVPRLGFLKGPQQRDSAVEGWQLGQCDGAEPAVAQGAGQGVIPQAGTQGPRF